MTALQKLIRNHLLGFDWGDYGLDLVSDAESDWAEALALQIATAITDRVEVEL